MPHVSTRVTVKISAAARGTSWMQRWLSASEFNSLTMFEMGHFEGPSGIEDVDGLTGRGHVLSRGAEKVGPLWFGWVCARGHGIFRCSSLMFLLRFYVRHQFQRFALNAQVSRVAGRVSGAAPDRPYYWSHMLYCTR